MVHHGSGAGTLVGGPGDDSLVSGPADDILQGGEGRDELNGDGGVDTLDGGPGSDQYFWQIGEGADTFIEDPSSAGDDDTITIRGIAGDDAVTLSTDQGGGVRVDALVGSALETIILNNFETIFLTPAGGADTVTIDDLNGTGASRVVIDLGWGETSNGNTICYHGSEGYDDILIQGAVEQVGTDEEGNAVFAEAVLVGDSVKDYTVSVRGSSPGRDRLLVQGLAGDDDLTVGAGSDGIRVQDLISVTLDGGDGDDTLRTVYSNVEIRGGAGELDHLVVEDDPNTTGRPNVCLDDDNVAVYRDGVLEHLIWYSEVELFDLDMSSAPGGSDLRVQNTITGPITIQGGGQDQLSIEALRGPTVIHLTDDGNAIILGREGTLTFIGSPLTIHGSTGYDRLTVDSSADTADRSDVRVEVASVTGLGLPAGGAISYDDALDEITLLMGLGDDHVQVPTLTRTLKITDSGGADTVTAVLWGAPSGQVGGPSIETSHVENVEFSNESNTQETNWLVTDDPSWEGVLRSDAQSVLKTNGAQLTTLNLSDAGGRDALQVWSIQNETHAHLRGGNDTVTVGYPEVGSFSGLKNINKPLVVDAAPGAGELAHLIIDDTANDISGRSGTLDA